MICNFMIFSESVGSGASLSATRQNRRNPKSYGDFHSITYNICKFAALQFMTCRTALTSNVSEKDSHYSNDYAA